MKEDNENFTQKKEKSTLETTSKTIKFSLSNSSYIDNNDNIDDTIDSMNNFMANELKKFLIGKLAINNLKREYKFDEKRLDWNKYFSNFHSLDKLLPERKKIRKKIEFIPYKINKMYDNVYMDGYYYINNEPNNYSQVISLLNEKPKRGSCVNVDILEDRANNKNIKPFIFLLNEERSKEDQRRRVKTDFWKHYPEYIKRFEQIHRPFKYDSSKNDEKFKSKKKNEEYKKEEETENDKGEDNGHCNEKKTKI